MSASTSPSTTSTSASLPASSVPNSSPRPMISAPVFVAQVIVSSGVKPTYFDEERQLLGVVAVRVPGEAVVAAHAEPAARLEDRRALSAPPSSVSLWPSITRCGMPNSGPRSMLRQLEVQRRHAPACRASSSRSSASSSMNVPCSSVS